MDLERAFYFELLDYRPLPITPLRYGDIDNPYFVGKLRFARSFPRFVTQRGAHLHAAVDLGPIGPIPMHHYVAFLEEGPTLRVNLVTSVWGRIARKATRLMPRIEADLWLSQLEALDERQPILLDDVQLHSVRNADQFSLLVIRTSGPTTLAVQKSLSTMSTHESPTPPYLEHIDRLRRSMQRTYYVTDDQGKDTGAKR